MPSTVLAASVSGSSATRWHFAHTAEKSGFAPSALAGFLAPDAAHTLARFASPARWQHALIAAAWLAAGALGWLLVNAYRGRTRAAYFGAPAVFTLAVADFGNAASGLTRWTFSETGGIDPARFAIPTRIQYPSFDTVNGKPRMIPAYYYRPQGAGPFPVLIVIHGGPEGQARRLSPDSHSTS